MVRSFAMGSGMPALLRSWKKIAVTLASFLMRSSPSSSGLGLFSSCIFDCRSFDLHGHTFSVFVAAESPIEPVDDRFFDAEVHFFLAYLGCGLEEWPWRHLVRSIFDEACIIGGCAQGNDECIIVNVVEDRRKKVPRSYWNDALGVAHHGCSRSMQDLVDFRL